MNTVSFDQQSLGHHATVRLLLSPIRRFRWLIAMSVLVFCALYSLFANSQAFIAYKTVSLSSVPLYATAAGDKPTMALALSVEYPTVGAQYVRDDGIANNPLDATYSNLKDYLGYYDAESCYNYNDTPTESPAAGQTTADYKRFDRVGVASSHRCTDGFSGNFLNWASNSAVDMLRLSLSGGDRYIDNANLTVLQRAVLPNGDPICMWNSTNFPAKQLQKDGGGAGQYWGAVPRAMVTAANGSDIWIANTLNQIYFGTSNTGDCNNTGAYNLSVKPPPGPIQPTITANPYSTPANALTTFGGTYCADENGTCAFTGRKEVLYGAYNASTRTGGWLTYVADNGASCSNATVNQDPIYGLAKKCYVRPFTGTLPVQANGLNSDGFFYARVSVCNSDSSGQLLDIRDYGTDADGKRPYCTRYPSGSYKPTGVIQKYSEQIRLAAFGYLLDQTASYNNGRYGGVLRAPMKYVGQKTFDIYGQENTVAGGNPNAEWDVTTGIFNSNPDNDGTQTPNISGVINYLNKFGRTGPVPGRYKIYDPLGELYYESLRYLQGLDPSPDAVAGANMSTATGKSYLDGFPAYTKWTGTTTTSNLDPYKDRSSAGDYSCLRSNIVVIGDIHTHDGNRFPASNPAKNIVSATDWRTVVQNFERNITSSYIDGQGALQSTGNPNGANNAVPRASATSAIMGAAYWAHTHDIRSTSWTDQPDKQRPGLRVKTFTFDVNEYAESSNRNNRRYSNQLFMAAKYGGFQADPSNLNAAPYNIKGNPFLQQDGLNENNVWQNPNQPGEAASYYLQSDAKRVLSAFDAIFGQAAQNARSIAGNASQGKNLTTDGGFTYQGSFDSSDWSGDLQAYQITLNDENKVTTSSTATWSASERLLSLGASAATSRNIVVGNKGPAPASQASNFAVGAIEASLKVDLGKLSPLSTPDMLADQRLAYLRGDRSLETTTFRVRKRILGDIINSGVSYSGAPVTNIATPGYADFYNNNKSRVPTVFVGANDGMLHAFNATVNQPDSGKELFAYIPSWMGPKLAALTSKTYNANHQSYVDGSSVVAEAQVGSAGAASDFKTILVGSTGAGGRGVFALDVTNPSAFSTANVMWEFTGLNDPDMGYVVGKPQILKLQTNAIASTPVYKYFAAVASGVNNSLADGTNLANATGAPALFLLDISKPVGTAWALNSNYFKISLPIPSSTQWTTTAPGLLNFSPVLDRFGAVSSIFMGDLLGNLWKLNFKKLNLQGSSDWTMSKLSAYVKNAASVNTPIPLFIATDASGLTQPITVAPRLFSGEGDDITYVAFGTGKYLEFSDRSSAAQQSVYAVLDDPSSNTVDNTTSAIAGRGRLQVGVVDTLGKTVNVSAFRWGRPASDGDTARRAGFYFDFPTTGERQASDGLVFGDNFVFGSLIPSAVGSQNTCGADEGSGKLWSVNIDKGNGSYTRSTVGLLGTPTLQIIPNSSNSSNSTSGLTQKDNTGRQTRTVAAHANGNGSLGIMGGGDMKMDITVGRLSWRQINNYQNLK
ncbi:pilus assembly protein [Xylophilus ampelinus]|uniref:Type IV pilus assembly protein PilY1 n=1 Tax=Xylophilus ampelinus TaxID=54067 RepID=A0A318SNT3_9BURK|nr:PilC/PilY family type IV pilus protein [Xylophilus ampelinus]MCS4509840.1 PilC/PilY family type IV pilus protein [Xylophilus ampelinus]PYE78607.1 type IV pilus assembly protein PilY1 [Xylophilus ampelinus]